jgi:hypothetical protein
MEVIKPLLLPIFEETLQNPIFSSRCVWTTRMVPIVKPPLSFATSVLDPMRFWKGSMVFD